MAIRLGEMPAKLGRQIPECVNSVKDIAKSPGEIVRRVRELTGACQELAEVMSFLPFHFPELAEVVR